jgi:3-deoxy-7-phosphoheptulonate synthase
MIDASHANSEKQHRRQIEVVADIAQRIAAGEQRITGVMIESHLEEGRQDLQPGLALRHGVSITDACVSWPQTEPMLEALAVAVRARRAEARGLSARP